jgi:hypothetical protein
MALQEVIFSMLPENQKNYYRHKERQEKPDKHSDRYRYEIFGLHVASDIFLPELLPAIDTAKIPGVRVILGKMPSSITGVIKKTESYEAAKNQFVFQVPGVGRYYISNGNSIVIEPAEQAEEHFVRLFLLGTVFGVLLMQRGILPIHGSAVVVNGGCVIFTGVSGAGKSTLLAAFRDRGYSFLTDDVAAVTVDVDGAAWVHSAYPQQKLWRDSAENMRLDTASLRPVYSGIGMDKFTVPVHKGFYQGSVPLVAVYELTVERHRDVTLKHLSGSDKLTVLMRHTYRSWLIDGLGLTAAHFKQCATVAGQIAVARLTRPEGFFSLEEQICIIQQDIAQFLGDRAV